MKKVVEKRSPTKPAQNQFIEKKSPTKPNPDKFIRRGSLQKLSKIRKMLLQGQLNMICCHG